MNAYQITVDTERFGPVRLSVTEEQVAQAMASFKSNPSAGLVLHGTAPTETRPMPLRQYLMTPYQRIRACGRDLEIKRGHVGWRVYLLDQAGQRVAAGPSGARYEVARSGSDSVAEINARMKSKRGFRRDSQMHGVLEVIAGFCEQAVAEEHQPQVFELPDGSVVARSSAPCTFEAMQRSWDAITEFKAAKQGGGQCLA